MFSAPRAGTESIVFTRLSGFHYNRSHFSSYFKWMIVEVMLILKEYIHTMMVDLQQDAGTIL